jgi:hypothetical protein
MHAYVLSITESERESDTYASMAHTHFAIESEIRKQYARFNAVGTQLTVRVLPPHDLNVSIASHFQDSVMRLLDYALRGNEDCTHTHT